MKKLLILAVTVIIAAVSCQKNSQRAEVIDDTIPAPVLFKSNLAASIVSKSAGALEQWSGNETLYIYGIERVNGKIDLSKAPFINNVDASSPSNVQAGSIEVYRDKSTLEYYYYESSTYYDFFGYYIDDAKNGVSLSDNAPEPVIDVNAGTISLPVQITGKEDIMLAKADPAEDVSGKNVDASKAYGAFAARRGVVPNLVFNHQLARFNFKIKAGNASTATNITVSEMTVASRDKATLVIASNDDAIQPGLTDFSGVDPVPFPLQLRKAGGLSPLTLSDNVKPQYNAAADYEGEPFGEPVLVIPGDSTYDIKLSLSQADYSFNNPFDVNLKIDFANLQGGEDNVAVAGHQYDVTLIVYGLEKVDVNVTLAEWKSSGSFIINPDV